MSTHTETPINLRSVLTPVLYSLQRPLHLLRTYNPHNLRADIMAGITVAVIMLPQSIAFALIADLPPQMGLYTAIIGAFFGALWGSSDQLLTGPTNALSLLVLGSLSSMFPSGTNEFIIAAGLLAVMVGTFQLVMGLARLGLLINFVSHSVIVGFATGAGILIGLKQIGPLLHLSFPSDNLFEAVRGVLATLPQTHPATAVLGIGSMLFVIILQRVKPRLPNGLLTMILASLVVYLLALDKNGIDVIGQLPRSFPPFKQLPIFDLDLIAHLSSGALAVAAIGLVQTAAISRTMAAQTGQRLDNNQEFVGQGLANIFSGFFSGYACAASFSITAVNFKAGARSPLAAVFTSLFVLAAMLLLAPLAAYLPRAALAAVLIVTAYGMIDRKEIKRIWRTSRGDAVIMVATLLATLFLRLEFAVLMGVLASFARYIAITSQPPVHSVLPDENFEHFVHKPERPVCPQLGVLTIEGSLYFGAAQHVEEEIRRNLEEHPGQRFLLLRMHRVNHCDVSGLHMLETVVRLYRQHGGDVFMVGVRETVWEKMRLSEFNTFLEMDHYLTQERAIEHIFYHILDPGICIYQCPVRAWRECQTLPKCEHDSMVAVGTVVPYTAVTHIPPRELWRQLMTAHKGGERPLVIDVREQEEFELGHIPQARLAPMPQILHHHIVLPKQEKIVLVCRSGRRSSQVAFALQAEGYTQVSNMEGGMIAWQEARLPAVID
ncbi:MAG: sulfate permease [Anaerolineales bacterium]|nr:sulfate permease [Anaerolineales bacterium]